MKSTTKLATEAQEKMATPIQEYFSKCITECNLHTGTITVTAEMTQKDGQVNIEINTQTVNNFKTGMSSN